MKIYSRIEAVLRIKILFVVKERDTFSYPGIHVVRVETERLVIVGKGGTCVMCLSDTLIAH